MSEDFLIAIVDDDAAVREALSDLLQVGGFSSRTYAGAAAFLEDHAAIRFDLLITDLRMPRMDGVQLMRALRAEGTGPEVIVVTSWCDPPTRARVLAEGALACVGKPVEDSALLYLVANLASPART